MTYYMNSDHIKACMGPRSRNYYCGMPVYEVFRIYYCVGVCMYIRIEMDNDMILTWSYSLN